MPNQVITQVTFVVNNPLTVTSPSPQPAVVGSSYQHQFTAEGGVAPYTWAIAGGTLPPGLSFSVNGLLSGTPTAAGNFSFQVTVSDNA